MTLLIQAANVEYAYGGNDVLTGATFEIRQGDRLALIGANGSGKSTLFRLLAGQLRPQGGALTLARGTRVGFLSQEPSFDPRQTVHEVIALAAGDPAALEERARELEALMGEAAGDDELTAIMDAHAAVLDRLDGGGAAARGGDVLTGLGFPFDRGEQPIGRLSGGEKKLVGLARLLVEQPDVLLLDEPDNHLDFAGKRWLETFVRNHHGAVAVISHDRYFIDRTANRIFELERGRIEGYPGNYAAYVREKRSRLERGAQLRELQEREFRKLKASAEQLTQWARQNPKFASRAENMRRKMAEEWERLESNPAPVLNPRQIDVAFNAERGSTLVLDAKALAKSFAERVVFDPFDLEIHHGEAVGLVGANGSGKTTLFRIIRGEELPDGGTLRLGPSVMLGYYAQEQETLDPSSTPMETVRRVQPMSEQAAIGFLNRYLFTRDDMLGAIGGLSGGQRARLQIAVLILQGANFLLLDEPTNNLDIPSVERLEQALLAFLDEGQGTMLAISHDRAFLDAVCGRIVELDNGEVRDYPGGFSFYEANRGTGALLTARPPEAVIPTVAKRGKGKAR
ncbi:MAG: ABC-F family ATP-binding cassette domain-containing protein [Chloroflexia bacterium]|nr:ABC-F family ATP-binding cassette domain-containing protein [Chloroflexia bacterium]